MYLHNFLHLEKKAVENIVDFITSPNNCTKLLFSLKKSFSLFTNSANFLQHQGVFKQTKYL